MTISAYITHLEAIKAEYGDLEVKSVSVLDKSGRKPAATPEARHERVPSPSSPYPVKVKGIWSPRLHPADEKGELIVWIY